MSEKTSRKLVGFPMVMGIRHVSRRVVPSCGRRWWTGEAVRPASAEKTP
jgi:hypothetical protein